MVMNLKERIEKWFFLKKWANPGLFFVSFRCFQTDNTIFTTNICEKCPSSKWCWDSNPRPSERESLPITTRLGLPTKIMNIKDRKTIMYLKERIEKRLYT